MPDRRWRAAPAMKSFNIRSTRTHSCSSRPRRTLTVRKTCRSRRAARFPVLSHLPAAAAFIRAAHMRCRSAVSASPAAPSWAVGTGRTAFSMERAAPPLPQPRESIRQEPHYSMARIKLAYIGGGSTRAAGTLASFISQGENWNGSEVVLIDPDREHLEIVRSIATRMALAAGLDLTIHATTDRRSGLTGCDAVLTSFRPGGFAARYLDESIPLKHGVIGQETQGPGGFFMALRSIFVMKS